MPAQTLLDNALFAIHAINAVDAHALGLIGEDETRSYLRLLLDGLPPGGSSTSNDENEKKYNDIRHQWLNESSVKDKDPRPSVRRTAVTADHERWGTVMTKASFNRKFRSSALESLYPPGNSTGEKITRQKTKETDATPKLIWGNPCRMWIAPSAEQAQALGADRCRDKLGLDHLPFKKKSSEDKHNPEELALICLVLDNEEIDTNFTLKRPALWDRPGERFRALTDAECGAANAVAPTGHTVCLNTLKDGFPELTFFANEGATISKYEMQELGELTAQHHPNADNHTKFRDHLINRQSSVGLHNACRDIQAMMGRLIQ